MPILRRCPSGETDHEQGRNMNEFAHLAGTSFGEVFEKAHHQSMKLIHPEELTVQLILLPAVLQGLNTLTREQGMHLRS